MADGRTTASRPRHRMFIVNNPDDNDSDGDVPRSLEPGPVHSAPLPNQTYTDPAPRPRPLAPPPLRTQQLNHNLPSQRSNPPLSSPSSTSSPAVDTTPPPSTPGKPGSVDLTPDGNPRKDVSSPPANGRVDMPQVQQWGEPPPSRHANPISPPAHYRNASDHARPLPSPTVTERAEKVLVMVTTDTEQLSVVDISGAREPAFIREKIFSILRIPDEDQQYYSIHRHEIGSTAIGDALSDNQLFALCRELGDAQGTLKFFVSHSSVIHSATHYSRPAVLVAGHIPPPPILTPEADVKTRPLQPRRQQSRSRHDSFSDASERFPIRESNSTSYDASVSDDMDELKRSTIRPPPRQLPSTYAAKSATASSPHVSPIPDSLRPHSPHTNIPPPLPLPREGDTQPLVINKIRSPPVQSSYPHSPRGPDLPRDEIYTLQLNGGHSRTPSEAAVETLRPMRPTPTLTESPETPSSVYAAPVREEKDRTEQLRRRGGIIKPEWSEAARLQAVGSSETLDSKVPSSQGDWIVVQDTPQSRGSPSSATGQESARASPTVPMPRPTRRKSGVKNSPIRPNFPGRLPIPNHPRNPPPPPPIAVNDGRSTRQAGQAISAATTKRWVAATGSKGDAKSLTPAKSMFDLRGGNGNGGTPPSLPSNRPSTRRPSTSRPTTGTREDNQATLDRSLGRTKGEVSPHLYPQRTGMQPSSSSSGRPHIRPLPDLDSVTGRGPPSGSALSSAALSSAALPSASLLSAALSSANSSYSYGSSSSFLPLSADRTQSPTSARPKRPQQSMQSPPLPESRSLLSPEISRSPAMTATNISPRQPYTRTAHREDEGTATVRALPTAASQPYLRDRATQQANGHSNVSTSLPRDPIIMARPPRTDSRDALSNEHLASSQTNQISLSSNEDKGGFESTFRPEDHEWLRKAIQESEGDEGTLRPPPRVENKQLPPPPAQPIASPTPPLPLSASYATPWVPVDEDDDEEDDEDTGTLWIARPKSVAPPPPSGKPNVPPIHTRDFLNHPPPVKVSMPPPRSSSRKPSSPTEPFARGERPPAEDMYERLDAYFPEHDLDKPVLDATSGGASPTNSDVPTQLVPSTVAPPSAYGQAQPRYRHKKSIRHVAAEHKKRIDRTSRMQSTAADVLRKRSTKLWGSKLEEVTSSQAQAIMSNGPESPSSANPKPIFKWVRGELIGKGTYGRVYVALNATTGEMIAVKQVEMPRTASDREDTRQVSVVEALKSESETLKDLDHPHIVQYLGFEETPEFLSIFLEYVPGGSVGSCLRKHGKFSENVTKSFTEQILEGLEYLHLKGILHRDLKADNILVEASGICKISDFGISKRTDDINQGAAFTAMQGTVFWMAPEVVKTNKKGYSFKIDIWSIGCLVLEMWAGRRPWNDEEAVTVMYKLYHQDQIPPVPTGVTLSQTADDFRRKCFAINPEERPSASELRRHPYLQLPPWWIFNGDFKNG